MSSFISIQIDDNEKQCIAVLDNHYDLSCHKSICFYFAQLEAVFYCEVPEEKMSFTIDQLVRQVIDQHQNVLQGLVSPSQKEIKFVSRGKFDKRLENTTVVSVEINHYQIIVVTFPNLLELKPIQVSEPKIKIRIPLGKVNGNQVQVDFTAHKKFKIRDLLLFYKMHSNGHSGLRVRGKIVKYIEHLSKLNDSLINLKGQSFSGTLVYTYQIFYDQMRKLMRNDSLKLVKSLCKSQQEWQKIQQRGRQLSVPMSQITKYVILYLTSPYFDPKEQTEYFRKYFNGKVHFSSEDLETQKMSLLVHHILELCSHETDSETVYLSETVDESAFSRISTVFIEKSIVKFETFLSCHSNRNKLQLPPGKSSIIYKISPVSAKSVGLINFKVDGPDYICLPYTEYYIEKKQKKGANIELSLIQMPIPKCFNKNLVIWVDNKISQARGLNLEQKFKRKVDLEIVILKDNTLFEFWLKRYNSTTNNRKIGVISNMVRGSDAESGITTLRITHQYLGKVPFFYYVGDIHKCKQLLKDQKIDLEENNIQVSSRKDSLIEYIQFFSQFTHEEDMESNEFCCGKQACEIM